MHDVVSAAERLRTVRRAYRRFLTLWALDCAADQAKLLDRVVSGLQEDIASQQLDIQWKRVGLIARGHSGRLR